MKKDILVKVHKAYRLVIAIMDKDLKDKVLKEGRKVLDLRGEFFDGIEANYLEVVEEIEAGMAEDATFNIVGKRAVEIAKKVGIINENSVRIIEDIPYAMVLL